MIPFYLIELHPVKKIYLDHYHYGFIVPTSSIDAARRFNSYKEAHDELKDLINMSRSIGDEEFYISIVEFYQKID